MYPITPEYPASEVEKTIIVKPTAIFRNNIPSMKNTNLLSMLPQSIPTNLSYDMEQDIFYTSKSFDNPYNMSYIIREFDTDILSEASTIIEPRYLSIPEQLAKNLRSLAENITKKASSSYEKALALESFLKSNFTYNENFTLPPNGIDPVEWFLFYEKKGICIHFNTAFVLMARTLGLPSRLVGGFLVDDAKETQEVTEQNLHAYSEVFFEGCGWVTFDATAPIPNTVVIEYPAENELGNNTVVRYYNETDIPGFIETSTTILFNNESALKGENFTVIGTVTTEEVIRSNLVLIINRRIVNGLLILIELRKDKGEKGIILGESTVINGTFNIICTIPRRFDLGSYHVVARTLGNGFYNGSSSDPPITVMARTKIDLSIPEKVISGRQFLINGTLKDKASNEPISGASITLNIDGGITLARTLKTDKNGSFIARISLSNYGTHRVTASYLGLQYYLNSSNEKQVKVPEFMIVPLSSDIVRGQTNIVTAIVMADELPVDKENVLVSLNKTQICYNTTDINGYINAIYDSPSNLTIGNAILDYKLEHFGYRVNQTVSVMAKTFIGVVYDIGNQVEIIPKLVDNLGTPIASQTLVMNTNSTATSLTQTTNSNGETFFKFDTPAGANSIAYEVKFKGNKYLLPSELLDVVIIPHQTGPNNAIVLLMSAILVMICLPIAMLLLKKSPIIQKAITEHDVADAKQDIHGNQRRFYISFPHIQDQFPFLWGESDPLLVRVESNLTQDDHAFLTLDDGRIGRLELRTQDYSIEFVLEKGIHTFGIVMDDKEVTRVQVEIVDYKEEVVHLYNDYFISVKRGNPILQEDTTPREFESIVRENIPISEHRALDSLISIFEIADYSLHTITRTDYEETYACLSELRSNGAG